MDSILHLLKYKFTHIITCFNTYKLKIVGLYSGGPMVGLYLGGLYSGAYIRRFTVMLESVFCHTYALVAWC